MPTSDQIATWTQGLTTVWGIAPVIRLACEGGADEHWQAYHPAHMDMPVYVWCDEGIERHPDAPHV